MVSPPRGRLATLAPHAAFWALLAAIWVSTARTIAGKVADRCLGPGGSPDECELSLVLPGVAAIYSLIVLAALWLQEGEFLEDGVGADGALPPREPAVELGVGRPRPPVREINGPIGDSDAVLLIFFLCMACVVITVFGAVLQLVAGRERGSLLWRMGYGCTEGGCLGLSVAICILIIPYMMIRLMRLHREKGRGTDTD